MPVSCFFFFLYLETGDQSGLEPSLRRDGGCGARCPTMEQGTKSSRTLEYRRPACPCPVQICLRTLPLLTHRLQEQQLGSTSHCGRPRPPQRAPDYATSVTSTHWHIIPSSLSPWTGQRPLNFKTQRPSTWSPDPLSPGQPLPLIHKVSWTCPHPLLPPPRGVQGAGHKV